MQIRPVHAVAALAAVTGALIALSATALPATGEAPDPSWRETSVPIVLAAVVVCGFIVAAALLLAREMRRQAALARALGDANDRYHKTIDSVVDAIVAVDENLAITLFNPAAESMFGVCAQDMLGQPLDQLLPVQARDAHRAHLQAFMRAPGVPRGMAPNVEIRGRHSSGAEFPIESTISRAMIGGKAQLTAVLRDMTNRRHAQADLREMNRQLRALSASLQGVREQERKRIASELHDELGPQLTSLKLDLSGLGSRLREGRPPTGEEVDAIHLLLDTAIASVRRIAADMGPLILDGQSLGDAIARHGSEFARRSGLAVTVERRAAPPAVDDVTATALFGIVQEALTNIVRHAKASHVWITLEARGGRVLLTVRDDGSGMARGERSDDGVGLVSMRERASALGGTLHIASTPQVGTSIEVALPLLAAKAAAPVS